jgi:formylglycine-generating enzyme required for sulfatase activity
VTATSKRSSAYGTARGNPLYYSGYPGSADIGLNDAGMYEWGESDYAGKCTGKTEQAAAGGLSWWGAKLMCEVKGKRLPTEAEWEAAARGQTKLIWPCAWYHQPCWYGLYECYYAGDECYYPEICGCGIPFEDDDAGDCDSPDGASGMYGNAAEWVLDGKDGNHEWCANGCTDPEPREGDLQVLKGGSLVAQKEFTRISARKVLGSDAGNKSSGASCVRSPVSFGDTPPDVGSDSGPD